MSDLAEVVFEITPAGFAALRNAASPMELQLKTVLTLVDGVCPVAQYRPFLGAFEPLTEKFQILERMLYLSRVGHVSNQAVSRFQQDVSLGGPPSNWRSIDAESQDSGFLPTH